MMATFEDDSDVGGFDNDNDLDEGLVQPMMWLRQGETGSELEGIVGIYR